MERRRPASMLAMPMAHTLTAFACPRAACAHGSMSSVAIRVTGSRASRVRVSPSLDGSLAPTRFAARIAAGELVVGVSWQPPPPTRTGPPAPTRGAHPPDPWRAVGSGDIARGAARGAQRHGGDRRVVGPGALIGLQPPCSARARAVSGLSGVLCTHGMSLVSHIIFIMLRGRDGLLPGWVLPRVRWGQRRAARWGVVPYCGYCYW